MFTLLAVPQDYDSIV